MEERWDKVRVPIIRTAYIPVCMYVWNCQSALVNDTITSLSISLVGNYGDWLWQGHVKNL